MADIAMVFHWPPTELNGMSVGELMEWRQQARDRWPEDTS